jgi:hypothetical protein
LTAAPEIKAPDRKSPGQRPGADSAEAAPLSGRDPAQPAPQSASIEERRRREAEALRQNLLRRKAQSRARADQGDQKPNSGGSS